MSYARTGTKSYKQGRTTSSGYKDDFEDNVVPTKNEGRKGNQSLSILNQLEVGKKVRGIKSRFAAMVKSKRGKGKGKVKSKRNPGNVTRELDRELDSVSALSTDWHGREPLEEIEVDEIETYDEAVANLALLLELQVLSSDEKNIITIEFSKDKPNLCADKTASNLEIIGGDQELDIPTNQTHGKRLYILGYCVSIAYETDKHHLEGSNGSLEAYEHYFGEEFYKDEGYSGDKFFKSALQDGVVGKAKEKGLLPMVVYDCWNQKILLTGGKYTIQDVGIVN